MVALALAGQALAGAGAGWHNVAADTLIQQHVPAHRLGTVYMFPYAAEVLAYVAGAPLLTAVGPRWVFAVSGIGVLATIALIFPMLSAAVRRSAAPVPSTSTAEPAAAATSASPVES